MNADLHMAEDLKNTGKGSLFVVFDEPDIDILDAEDSQLRVKINGVDVFHPNIGEVRSDGIAFDKPKSGRITAKVINHLVDEVIKVFVVGNL